MDGWLGREVKLVKVIGSVQLFVGLFYLSLGWFLGRVFFELLECSSSFLFQGRCRCLGGEFLGRGVAGCVVESCFMFDGLVWFQGY